jgi:hypothetical protein
MAEATEGGPKIARGWKDGSISLPALVILVVVMTAAALGAACINGSFGVVVIVVVLLSVVGLLFRWSGAPR